MITAKQDKFIREYIISLNQTDAARKAGYKHPDVAGTKLMKIDNIKKEIQKNMDERNERLAIDADYVLRELHSLYQRFTQSVRPALNSKTGKPIKDEDGNALYRFDGPSALKALELMGKHLKVDAFSPHRHSIDANDRLVEILTSARRRVGLVGEDGNGQ